MATPRQFRRRGRWFLILGTLLAALTVGAVMAFASGSTVGNTITWTGQGVPVTQLCGAADDPFGANQPYMQWNLTQASGVTSATLTVNGDTYDFPGPDSPSSVGDSVIKWFTPYYNTSPLPTATITYVGTLGANPQFTISHGCIGKKSPTIETDPGEGGFVGATLNDTATLAGGSTSPAIGGTITFKLFPPSDSSCAGSPVYTDVVTVNGNDTYDTTTQGDNPGGYESIVHGSYQWTADYSGDTNNNAASSGCGKEAFVTATGASTVLTEVRDTGDNDVTSTEVPLGSVVHDHATVSSDSPFTPEGKVDFIFYKGTAQSPCSGDPVSSQNGVDLVNGEADSNASDPLGPGNYGYIVNYHSSDTEKWTDGNGTCEPFTVDQGQLTADTILHDADHGTIDNGSNLDLGSVVHDTAHITGQVDGFDPTGAVTFAFYSGKDCTGDPTAFTNTGADEVTSPDQRSKATDALAPGDYGFKATVAGDTNYLGDTSDCEPFHVNQGQLDAKTKLHNASHGVVADNGHVAQGTDMHDTAQISGQVQGFDPTGAVTFTFYKTIDCTDTGTDAGNNSGAVDSSSGDPRSDATAALGAGSYGFTATVAGDDNYLGDTSACEPFIVDKGTLSLVTHIHMSNAAHTDVTNGSVAVNSVVHDTAHVTGQVGNFAPDLTKVAFAFYTTGNCTGTSSDPGNIGFDEVVTTDRRTNDSAALGFGSYSYLASFAGDDNYKPITSGVACESLGVHTFGKTMGYWHNTNGQARIPSGFTYVLGTNSATTCYLNVTKANTLTILPGQGTGLNGTSLLSNCSSKDPNINANSINVLLAQTLALKLNIQLVNGFDGQTIGSLSGTVPAHQNASCGSLTTSSTVQNVLDYANCLIANVKLNNGVVVTQDQIGDLNLLMGQVNKEGV